MPVTTTPHTHEMVIIHRVFRREAALLPRLVDEVRDGDLTRIAVDSALPLSESGAEASARAALVERLHDHRAVLLEHLCDEENQLLPLVADHLTVEEWDEVGRRGLETIPKNKVMLALGAILEDSTPSEQQYFMKKVPPPGRLLWRLIGRRQYRRYVTELRGPTA